MFKRIFLTGATGTLGGTLKVYLKDKYEVIAPLRDEFDLSKTDDILSTLKKFRPDLIVHTAAITDVDYCELHSEEAYLVNWIATKMLSLGAKELDVPLIYISTDYVFPGDREVYMEWDNPSPVSVYGRSKYFGEREVLLIAPVPYVIRVSWLFGPNGKNFFSRIGEVLKRETLEVVVDQRSCPTYAPFLSKALLEFIDNLPPPGIYHLPGNESATPYEFTEVAAKILSVSVDLKAVLWKELKRPAPRPKFSVLRNYALRTMRGISVPGWKVALRDFLKGDT